MSTSESPIKPFKNQDYYELKAKHNQDNLFEDPEFPGTDQSIGVKKVLPPGIKWMRPKEARKTPKFVSNGYDRNDMDQGKLGDCWFIAGTVAMIQNPRLFDKVVPKDQSFDENYAGIFHFRFWQYGEWVDVVVDDKLPFLPDGKFVFCSNKQDTNEFWGSLLEKAYAKLFGSYENLESGKITDALVDMSGGITERFDLKKLSEDEQLNFWNILEKAHNKSSLMGCSIEADPLVKEAKKENGLIRGHAFTITRVTKINDNKMLRIRNPWGNDVEWKGAWSDGSVEWASVSDQDKAENGVLAAKDGEFWMCYSDFMIEWDQVQICHLSADSYSDELLETDDDSDLAWKCTTYHSKWISGVNAGGSGDTNPARFWTNPQFLVKLEDVDKDDNECKADIVVSLLQKDSRLKKLLLGIDGKEKIQFRIYKIKDKVDINGDCKFASNQLVKVATSGVYINSREVTKSFRLDPGNYVIIPSTLLEDRNCDFMLRIFTEYLIETNHIDQVCQSLAQNLNVAETGPSATADATQNGSEFIQNF